jgi:hypothetical protein
MDQSQIPALHLNKDEFQNAVKAAIDRFSQIQKKHPSLKGYLVIALGGSQTGIGSSAKEILKAIPALVMDDDAKARINSFLKTPEPKDTSAAEKNRLKEHLEQRASALKYNGKCQIEIRFDVLNYELLRQLQADNPVDRALTPQPRASIRIVLGTVGRFVGNNNSSTHLKTAMDNSAKGDRVVAMRTVPRSDPLFQRTILDSTRSASPIDQPTRRVICHVATGRASGKGNQDLSITNLSVRTNLSSACRKI